MRRVLHCLVEVVHVQLPHEGLEVAVFEVLRQDLASELSDSVDDNSVASRTPSAKGSVAIAIENFKAFLIFFFFHMMRTNTAYRKRHSGHKNRYSEMLQ